MEAAASLLLRLAECLVASPSTRIEEVELGDCRLNVDTKIVPIYDCVLTRLMRRLSAQPPEATALLHGKRRVSVSEFLLMIKRAAGRLQAASNGKSPFTAATRFVALMLRRSAELCALMIAAWRCGRVVVPLDADWHETKRRAALAALPIGTLVIGELRSDDSCGHRHLHAAAFFDTSSVTVDRPSTRRRRQWQQQQKIRRYANELAYATFTSGTTSERPRLVLSEWSGLANLINEYTRAFGYTTTSVVYSTVSPSFDIFIADLFASLVNGAQLVLASRPIPDLQEIGKLKCAHRAIDRRRFGLQLIVASRIFTV